MAKIPVQKAEFEAAETPVLKRPGWLGYAAYVVGIKAPLRFQFSTALCGNWVKEHFHVKDGATISLRVSPEPSDDAWAIALYSRAPWFRLKWRRAGNRVLWPMFWAASTWLVERTGLKPGHQMRIYASLFVHEEG